MSNNNCHLLMEIKTNFPINRNEEIFYGPLYILNKEGIYYEIDFKNYENDFSKDHQTIYLRATDLDSVKTLNTDDNGRIDNREIFKSLDPNEFDIRTIGVIENMDFSFAKTTPNNLAIFPIKVENCCIREYYTAGSDFIDHFLDASKLSKYWLGKAKSEILHAFNLDV